MVSVDRRNDSDNAWSYGVYDTRGGGTHTRASVQALVIRR